MARACDALRPVCHARDVPLVVADHYRLVERLGIDGVHLTDGARQVRAVRTALGPDAIVGAFARTSNHDGMTAAEIGADYVAFGPAGASGLGDGSVAGLDLFAWWSETIEVPCVAEGALTPVLSAQLAPVADFVAVGAEIWAAEEPAALRALVERRLTRVRRRGASSAPSAARRRRPSGVRASRGRRVRDAAVAAKESAQVRAWFSCLVFPPVGEKTTALQVSRPYEDLLRRASGPGRVSGGCSGSRCGWCRCRSSVRAGRRVGSGGSRRGRRGRSRPSPPGAGWSWRAGPGRSSPPCPGRAGCRRRSSRACRRSRPSLPGVLRANQSVVHSQTLPQISWRP